MVLHDLPPISDILAHISKASHILQYVTHVLIMVVGLLLKVVSVILFVFLLSKFQIYSVCTHVLLLQFQKYSLIPTWIFSMFYVLIYTFLQQTKIERFPSHSFFNSNTTIYGPLML